MSDIVSKPPSDEPRLIASSIRRNALKRLISYAEGAKETTYVEQVSMMLWQLAAEGEAFFSEGTTLTVKDDPRLWLDLVKFLGGHLDGGVTIGTQNNTQNVFKVYLGIDEDKI